MAIEQKELLDKTIVDVTWQARHHWDKEHLKSLSYREVRNLVADIAEKFKEEYGKSEVTLTGTFMGIPIKYYSMCVSTFTDKCLAEELWKRFGDIPMDPETECIEQDWNGFKAGTFREDIWHWFEKTFNVSVAKDLMHVA